MKFSARDWLGEIVVGGITGAVAAAVGAQLLPGQPLGRTIMAGGLAR